MTKPNQIDIAARVVLLGNIALFVAVIILTVGLKIKTSIDNREISDFRYRMLSHETTEAVQDLIWDSYKPDGKITNKEYHEIERFEAEIEFLEKIEEWKNEN